MFIECPACSTKFVVQADKVGQGRRVRCGLCRHEWFYDNSLYVQSGTTIPVMEHMSDYLAPIPYGGNVPAVIYKPSALYRAFQASLLLTALVLCALLLLLAVNRITTLLPAADHLYQLLGIHRTDGISLQDVSIEPLADSSQVRLQGVMINQADKPRYLPSMRLAFYADNQRLLGSYPVDADHLPQTLPAGQEVRFDQLFSLPSGSVARVVLDMGNGAELALR